MRGRITGHAAVLAALLTGASGAGAQGATDRWHASVTLASEAFEYGLAQTDGGPAWRLAADYQHPKGFFAGAFVGNVDYPTEYGWRRPRDRQLGFYGGYQSRGPNWSARGSVARYRYPGISISYDYTIVSAGADYRDRFFFNVAHSPDWLGFGNRGNSYDIGMAEPLGWDLELGLTVGRMAIDDYADGRFTFWNVGLSKVVDRFAIDLRYHTSTADRPTWLGDPGARGIALSVAYAIAPRSR